uniref:RING-type domain-containing protein n=1 Tax=Salarias fasciatus TaxID=181472 RepID=A0A672I4X9_SALFA
SSAAGGGGGPGCAPLLLTNSVHTLPLWAPRLLAPPCEPQCEWYTAFVNITYLDPVTLEVRTEKTECGRYGEHSPKREAKGLVVVPALLQDRQACEPGVRFPVLPNTAWVALVAAGNCTYREKIRNVASHNASAVVIYNVGSSSSNDTITMPHPDTGDVVAIMIPEPKGREILALLEQRIMVLLHITVGTRNLQKYVSRTSVVFVSISFIVLMIISLAWLVFYYIQRFRYANARDRNQRRLGDAAKKAISKLQVRTIKKGDKETESDFDNCAVCIEGYRPNDVVRILPCRHVFHKHCVDPWLQDHRTCPMCKMNILKALGILVSFFRLHFDLDHVFMFCQISGIGQTADSVHEANLKDVPDLFQLNPDCSDEIPPDYETSVGGPICLNVAVVSCTPGLPAGSSGTCLNLQAEPNQCFPAQMLMGKKT